MRELIRWGEIGDVQYVDSVRINLGMCSPTSTCSGPRAARSLDPGLCAAAGKSATGGGGAHTVDPIGDGERLPGLPVALAAHRRTRPHHVNWLSPTKIRTTLIGGSRRTIVWDDMNPTARLLPARPRSRPDPAERLGPTTGRRRSSRTGSVTSRWRPRSPRGGADRACIVEFARRDPRRPTSAHRPRRRPDPRSQDARGATRSAAAARGAGSR